MTIRIVRLTVDDLPACLALGQDRDWPVEDAKWRILFQLGDVYGARDDTGALVGTTILTRYNDAFSVVSMVLVAKRCGKMGLGRRLMIHALSDVEDEVTMLCSTDLGRPLYDKLGFLDAGILHTHVGYLATSRSAPESRSATAADLPAIIDLDAEVNGTRREALMNTLHAFAVGIRVVTRAGMIIGYGAAWQNNEHLVVGPIVAQDDTVAETLIRDLADGFDGLIRVDIPDYQPGLRKWAERQGLIDRSSAALMVRGRTSLPGDRSRWFSPVMQALG